jgi:hypothetical protein
MWAPKQEDMFKGFDGWRNQASSQLYTPEGFLGVRAERVVDQKKWVGLSSGYPEVEGLEVVKKARAEEVEIVKSEGGPRNSAWVESNFARCNYWEFDECEFVHRVAYWSVMILSSSSIIYSSSSDHHEVI